MIAVVPDESAARSPVAVRIAGREVVLHHGDAAGEYDALVTGAALFDRSQRLRLTIGGAKAAETLTGLVTNDVRALVPGHGLYAAALTPKGKILADLRVFALPDAAATEGAVELLLDAPPRAGAALLDMLRKYVNPRVAPVRDVTASLDAIGVFGPTARHVIEEVLGLGAAALAQLPPYAHLVSTAFDVPVRVAHVPDLGDLDGYELWLPGTHGAELRERLRRAGARPAGLAAWEIARVEAGRPEWGLDIDEGTIAQEANLDELNAISYTKGCYTGQETVARVHFRGHVNRHLRTVHFDGDVLPPLRSPIHDATGKAVGDVRSALRSPRHGVVAIVMLRREVAVDAVVTARWTHGAPGATADESVADPTGGARVLDLVPPGDRATDIGTSGGRGAQIGMAGTRVTDIGATGADADADTDMLDADIDAAAPYEATGRVALPPYMA